MNFGAVKLAGSISCTVYIYCVATGLTSNSKVAGIWPPSLGFPILGEVEMRYYLNSLAVGFRCYDLMAVLLVG